MALKYSHEEIGEGINFTSLVDSRFKTNYITINLITDLNKEKAALNAATAIFLSKGNNKYKTISELNKKLASLYGANLAGDVFKLGDSQGISLSASCIVDRYTFNNEKITEELTKVLTGCLLEPNVENGSFNEKAFNLCRQELIDDIDAEINDKRTYAVIQACKEVFKGEPAALTSHGDKESAEKLNAKDAYEQYKKVISEYQIEIFFAGGGNGNEVKAVIKEAFSKINRNYVGKSTSHKSSVKSEVSEKEINLDVVQSKMVMAFKTNDENKHAVILMNAIFGTTPFSKLFANVREKLSLCYYCSSMYDERKGVLLVDSGVEKENIGKAKAEILNQVKQMQEGNFTDEEIKNAGLSLVNMIKTVNDSAYSLANWYMKQRYIDKNNTPEEEIEKLKNVTREDIIAAAKSLKLDTVFVLTDKGGEN